MDERPMRRKDRQSSDEQARELLTRGSHGVLSTVSSAGEPYGVPISYVYRDGEVYFHSAPEGRKVENLAPGARVSFCVVGETEWLPAQFSIRYESVIASGEIRELQGESKTEALRCLVEKYASEFIEQGNQYIATSQDKTRVFALQVHHLTGKHRR